MCFLRLFVAAKCITGAGPAGAKGGGFREVAGYSVIGPSRKWVFIGHWGPRFTLLRTCGPLQKKRTQGEGGITDGFFLKYDFIAQPGGQGIKSIKN